MCIKWIHKECLTGINGSRNEKLTEEDILHKFLEVISSETNCSVSRVCILKAWLQGIHWIMMMVDLELKVSLGLLFLQKNLPAKKVEAPELRLDKNAGAVMIHRGKKQ